MTKTIYATFDGKTFVPDDVSDLAAGKRYQLTFVVLEPPRSVRGTPGKQARAAIARLRDRMTAAELDSLERNLKSSDDASLNDAKIQVCQP
jgi:hypothetical protein